jgi:hypothetical protein
MRLRIVSITALYVAFAIVAPLIYVYIIGSESDRPGRFESKDWPLLLLGTAFFRGYDLYYYQLVRIGRAAWSGTLADLSIPDRPFSKYMKR